MSTLPQSPDNERDDEERALESTEQSDADDTQANLPVPARQVDRYVESFQQWAERMGDRIDALSEYIAPHNATEEMAPENIARSPIVFGMFLIILLFGVFGLWAVVAPIDSAAIAMGKVVLDSNKKTIDHFEGGIVEEILVSEGMDVKEGQPLIRLDATAAKARLDLYDGQYVAARAAEARLIAERDAAENVIFPKELLDAEESETDVQANLDAQRRLFASRREAVEGKTEVLQQKIKQTDQEIIGLEEQIKAADEQLRLLNEETQDVRHLVKEGLSPKSRLLALERRSAEIQGEKGERQALISRAQQTINEAKIEMYNLKTDFLNQVVAELKETQGLLSDLEEQRRAAQDVVKRIVIKAPIAGEVTGLKIHTVGGVIGPGEAIMSIVPMDDKLIVEARISPQDIDVVRRGLLARVRLSAYKTRNVPPVEGEVVTISADRFEDERTMESYFLARIEIDEDQLQKLEGVELSPGMPVEVLIVTGERTMFGYLMAPIRESFNRSFREQ